MNRSRKRNEVKRPVMMYRPDKKEPVVLEYAKGANFNLAGTPLNAPKKDQFVPVFTINERNIFSSVLLFRCFVIQMKYIWLYTGSGLMLHFDSPRRHEEHEEREEE